MVGDAMLSLVLWPLDNSMEDDKILEYIKHEDLAATEQALYLCEKQFRYYSSLIVRHF